jgi:hypothetical protein
MKSLLCLLLLALASPATAQVPAEPAQGRTVQGIIQREGTAEPVVGAQVSLTIPAIAGAADSIMNLAAAYGMPPSALGEIRQMITEMMQASTAELQSEINDAKNGGAPPEFVAILNQILVSKNGAPGFPKNAVTDNAGRFAFANVPAGNYLITAEREGFFGTSAKGTNARSKSVSMPVTVVDRGAPSDVTLSLTPGGRIQGSVRDRNGQPLPNLNVQAFTRAYLNGAPVLQSVATQKTDDRGEFRLFWLEPGDYLVAATPEPIRGISPATNPREVPVQTFYPSNASYADSIPLPVMPGQEVTGMGITMRMAPAVKIRGQLFGLPALPPTAAPNSISTTLKFINVNDPSPNDGGNPPSIVNAGAGTFEIPGITAGSYELILQVMLPRLAAGGPRPELWSRVPVVVRDRDIEGLAVALRPGIEVRGKVTVHGGAPGALKEPAMVGLQPDGIFMLTDNDGGEPAPTAADGSFSFPNIVVGDYKVRVFAIPPNAYVADVRQEGASIYASGFRISEKAPQPIEVTIGLDGGTVEGVTAPATTVVLVPTRAAERLNSERYKMVTSDAQGRFKITGMAPGPYKAFAWQTLPLGAFQNAAFLGQFEPQGAVVEVAPSSSNTVRVVVIQN